MGQKNILLILCLSAFWEVDLMSLKGPALTRYDPCGLGLLHFDRVSRNVWQGVFNFGIYSNIRELEIIVGFEKDTTIFTYYNKYNITAREMNGQTLRVHSISPIPYNYTFFMINSKLNVNESDVPTVSYLTMNNVTLCNDKIKAAQTISSLIVTNNFPDKPHITAHVCGRRSLVNEELISLRTEARAGDWPWHVAIFVTTRTVVPVYECGGSIVSSTAIVTAGHCVAKNGVKLAANQVIVIAGSINHTDTTHIGRQLRNAADIILHPAYTYEYTTSDLAIIRVRRLEFTEYVQPICIWGPVYDKTDLFGKEATVVGFGSTEYNKQSNVLRSSNILVQNDTVCIDFSPGVYSKLLDEFSFCAGYGPSSRINPRNGDSGGGLVIPKVQSDHIISWHLRGVLSKCGVSPGQKECDPSYYVIYTDVGPHYGWIYHHAGIIQKQYSNII